MGSVNHFMQLTILKIEPKRLSRVCTIILLLLTVWILGKVFWAVNPSYSVPTWSPAESGKAVATASESVDTKAIQDSHLFGRYQKDAEPAPVKQEVKDAPKSRLNVILVGVVQSSNAEKSLAVIARQNKQVTYGVGEIIEGTRAKVKIVLSDRVIIDNQGRDETVMLNGDEYRSIASTSGSRPKPVRNEQPDNSAQLAKIKSELSSNPQQLFQYVRMSQVKRDNQVLGYRLSAGREAELFRSVGLKEGDIATHINGLALSDPAAMNQVFKTVSDMTEINLTVERDGQPYDIYIEF
ncbi:type II secretion system protein GspC [Vibrio sonorensis]|uniref:type II secretion system protein GspC n=1 Tax=Vibrio sonorensis TaxID=1004316 RepID=UPI000A9431E6|nr:type II secretion system protein GspC [Vibrio sonorensis]